MNGGTDEIQTDASLQQAELDRVLAAVPEFAHLVFPLKRKLVAAAADEIRRLRVALLAPPHGDTDKTYTSTSTE